MTRKVVTRSPQREVGVVNPSWLLDHPVEHESHLEKNFIMVALACPVVKDIVHQPLELEILSSDDKTRKYTPDFLIRLVDGTELIVEVKPEVFVEEHKLKLHQAKKLLAAQGTPFIVVTDKHINAKGLSARAMLLMRYARLTVDSDLALQCMELLEQEFQGSAQIHELVSKGISEALIWNMVATHRLKVPVGINMTQLETVAINDQEGGAHDYFCTWFGIA